MKILKWAVYILLFVVVAGGVLVTLKWKTWFANKPETSYEFKPVPERVIMVPGESLTSRIVTWVCDTVVRPSDLLVAVNGDTARIEAQGRVVASRAGKSAFYSAQMPLVAPGDSISYRVMSGGNESRWFSARQIRSLDSLSLVYVGDIQDTLNGISGQMVPKIDEKIPEADLWIMGGDVIERPMDCFWNHWVSSMHGILQSKPVMITPGNHEYLKGINPVLEQRWKASLPFPTNGPESFLGSTYVVNHPLVQLISIDTQGIKGMMTLFETRAWLKDVLSKGEDRWQIVVMHHPIHSAKKGRNNVFIKWAFTPLFEEFGVDLVLQGHDHIYNRTLTDGDKAPVYLLSCFSHKSYVDKKNSDGSRVQLPLEKKYMFENIRLDADSMVVDCFYADGTRFDGVVIYKDGTVKE